MFSIVSRQDSQKTVIFSNFTKCERIFWFFPSKKGLNKGVFRYFLLFAGFCRIWFLAARECRIVDRPFAYIHLVCPDVLISNNALLYRRSTHFTPKETVSRLPKRSPSQTLCPDMFQVHLAKALTQRSLHFFSTTSPLHLAKALTGQYRSLSDAWFRPVGEGALLLRFGTDIDIDTNTQVLDFMRHLDSSPPQAGITEILPAYASLLIHFDPTLLNTTQVEAWCRQEATQLASASTPTSSPLPRTVSIPVHYGGKHGPDLQEAAALANLASADEAASIHASGDYRVYFLGFTGGFPYMGGLPKELMSVPRLTTPRQLVPKGAVGIAAGQTGVYTLNSPGGWYLLGQTFMPLFKMWKYTENNQIYRLRLWFDKFKMSKNTENIQIYRLGLWE